MRAFKSIIVTEGPNHRVIVKNPTDLRMIGSGDQGAVFRLSPEHCVKIYAKTNHARREARAYYACRGSEYFPKLVEAGPNYNILEYIRGISLKKYVVQRGGLPLFFTKQFVAATRQMKSFGFRKLDIPQRHIIITEDSRIKIIDLVNAYTLNYPKPYTLMAFLEEKGLLETFLNQVGRLDPELYREWSRKDG